MNYRVMVDMSVSLLHHGHVRLLRAAKEYGFVIVALTSDDEITRHKGFESPLSFEQRKEILESIKYVDEVVPSEWIITEDFLDLHRADFLVHGEDNSNPISSERLIILNRTAGISSTALRGSKLQ